MKKGLLKLTIIAKSEDEARKEAMKNDIEEILFVKEVYKIYEVLTTEILNEEISERNVVERVKP